MQEDNESWNWKVKCYLEDTTKSLYTEKDILVSQIIQCVETDTETLNEIDFDSLYDREIDELIRTLEIEHTNMEIRVTTKKAKERYWDD